MAALNLRQIRKTYDQQVDVIKGINLDIRDGEFVVFVGPSGCGKSTLLRMIAGLESISEGELQIGDRIANDLPPAERGIAMVFQSYALYPHMSVYDNMAFALKLAGASKQEIQAAVQRAADILQIEPLLKRKPKELSGGQRQRVAIGRAIVRKPDVFLFDEPLSNLDASLRVQMRVELSRLHQQLGTTMIYVTHDQVEAMTLGERIVVFNGGHIEQIGSPLELYQSPANVFVAGFLGSPKMNLIPAGVVRSSADEWLMSLSNSQRLRMPILGRSLEEGASCTLGIRSEHLQVLAADATQDNALDGVIRHLEHLGDVSVAYVELAGVGELVAVKCAADAWHLHSGAEIKLAVALDQVHVFNQQGRNLRQLKTSD